MLFNEARHRFDVSPSAAENHWFPKTPVIFEGVRVYPDDLSYTYLMVLLIRVLELLSRAFVTSWIFFGAASIIVADGSTHSPLVQEKRDDSSGMTIVLRQTPDRGEFVVKGLTDLKRWENTSDADLQKQFRVFVKGSDDSAHTPSLLGSYHRDANELRFQSRFPLSSNVQYQVTLGVELSPKSRESNFVFAPQNHSKGVPASVTNVFPSSEELPENTLKFYIHFSAPMSRGEAYERIHLYQEDKEVEAPFLELGEELWDAEQTRFTLFIHPGRIKRGVKPREDSGLPLSEGKNYSLVIDPQWRNAQSIPLEKRFVKSFRAGPSDDDQPDPEKWRIGTPKVNTADAVSLTFNESLDHAMLSRVLKVIDSDHVPVLGKAQVTEHETVWRFVPVAAWKKGVYFVDVASNLEDLAGNSIARPFETRSDVETDSTPAPLRVAIEFVVE